MDIEIIDGWASESADETTEINLLSSGVALEAAKAPGRWLVTIAKPGKGSSGNYEASVLREFGPVAFPPKTKSYFKHAKPEDRDPRDQVGYFEEGAFWNEEEQALQAILTPFPRYAHVIEEAKENIEASIHASMRKNVRTGDILELLYNRSNTVDLVAFGGLEGSRVEYAVESLFAEATASDEDEGKRKNVEIEKEIIALKTAVETLVSSVGEMVAGKTAEAQGVADEAAVASAVETRVTEVLENIATAEEAIDSADILEAQKVALKARARKGEDITEHLASAVAFAVEARKELGVSEKPANQRVRGNLVVGNESLSSDKPKNFSPIGW